MKTKHVKLPLVRVRNVRFFGKFDVLCFLETPVLRFVFLPYYRRIYSGLIKLNEKNKRCMFRNKHAKHYVLAGSKHSETYYLVTIVS